MNGKFRSKFLTFKGLYKEIPITIDFNKMIVVSLLTILIKILIIFDTVELKDN